MRTQRASIVYRLVAVVLLIVATGGAATPLRAARLQATTITFTGTELLGRPTANSVMVTILPNSTIEYYYEYGTASGVYTGQTTVATATGGQPSKTAIGGLASNQKYYYRMKYHLPGETDWVTRAEYSFRTQRAAGSTFTFDVTSDSHVNIILGNAARWTQALTRVANDAPDFLIDLGDTFAMDTVTTVAGAESAYKYQYQFFNLASASAPIFLAPGNHEQEEGWNLDDSPSQALLSINARKKYYPNPISDAFYSANTDTLAGIDGDHLREDYYAWQWGDVLFVVIDPYQYTMQLPYSPTAGEPNDEGTPTYDRWTWTLGQQQFNWLKSTLENSNARFKFVFAHHMVGGSADYVRGGANPAHMFEWGGYNLDGTTWGWSTRRPGWGADPIHQILVANGVGAFFHGHDHQYAYEKRDGVVYQSLPAASFTGNFGIYTTGSGYTVWADSTQGPGYLRVAVNPCQATVDYIDTNTGAVDYSYVIGSGGTRWTGATSTDWNTAGNWSCGVPANTCATDVVIPGGLANYPVLNAESWVRNLTIESGATLNGGSQTLHVCGNWANSGTFTGGTGTVSFEGTTAMSGGSANNNFNHVIIASGKSLSAGGETLNVNGNWTDNGTFTPGTSSVIFGGTTQTSQKQAITTYYLALEQFTGTAFPPANWSLYGAQSWFRGTGYYYSSPASASSGQTASRNAWLITPALALGSSPTLRFWDRRAAAGTHRIYACPTSSDCSAPPTNYTQVQAFDAASTTWSQQTVSLAAYADQSIKLAFQQGDGASAQWNVDDIEVYGPGPADQTFYDLTVASGTRTFLNNVTVNHDLTISRDTMLETGAYKVLSVGGSTTYLTGRLSNSEARSVGTLAVSFYDGRGAAMTDPTAQLTRGSGSGSYTVKTRAGWYFPDDDFGTTCPAATNAVWRYYNILAPDATSATVRLYYRDAELNGNTESELKIWHCSGGAWHEQAGTVTRDTGANWVQVTGVTDFSPFVLTSSQYGPTAVTLARFEAYVQDNQVVVEWETASERNSAGFFVYREGADGQRERVNRQIVPAFVGVAAGGVYRVVDAGAQPGGTYTYTLEEIEARGRSQRYGPFEVTAAQPAASLPAEDAGAGYARAVRPADLVAQPAQPASNRGLDVPALLPGAPGQPGILPAPESGTGEPAPEAAEGVEAVEPAPDAVIAAAPGAAKLSLTEAGLYYLDAGDIAPALGLSMSQVTRLIKSNGLQLTVQGQTVATLAASGNAGLYFYGQGLDSPYAADNVYWLAQAKGVLMGALKPKVPAAVGLATFGAVSHAEQDLLPAVGQFNDPAADYWLWDYVVAGDASLGRRSFAVQADGAAPAGAASLTARFLGLTDAGTGADHHAQIVLNGAVIGEAAWAGAEAHEVVLAVDPALLADGANTVEVVGLLDAGVPYSLFYVDGFDLSYPRYYRASNDALAFTSADSKAATVYGFSSSSVLVFDLSDPLRPVRVTALKVEAAEGGYRVTFKPAAAGAPHLAVAAAAVSRITTLAADAPSALTGPNGADYVIITTAALAEPAGALAAYRQGQGLAAQVVDVQDIYDEFNAGLANPQALRAFLAYAYANWAPAPRYVLLAGAGSYDYKNHLGYGDSLAPPLLVSTFDGLTAADSRYGDVVGDDGAPELAVGRLPVLTAGEFAAVIAKLQAYEAADPTGWSNQVLLLADNVDPEAGDFPADSAGLAAGLPAGYTAQQVYVGPLSAAEARGQALAALSSGVGVFSYIGHAGVDALAAERLLTDADVAGLQNGPRLGFMSAATCLVGDYSLPGYRSLGVALALQGDGGAAAVFSPTGASYNGDGVALATALFGELFGGAGGRAGDAARAALAQYAAAGGARYALDTYNLLGDPATVLAWR